jgi:hypothetical protein
MYWTVIQLRRGTSWVLKKEDKDLFLEHLMSQATYLMDTTLVRPKSLLAGTCFELIKTKIPW